MKLISLTVLNIFFIFFILGSSDVSCDGNILIDSDEIISNILDPHLCVVTLAGSLTITNSISDKKFLPNLKLILEHVNPKLSSIGIFLPLV